MTDKMLSEQELNRHFDGERAKAVMPSDSVLEMVMQTARGVQMQQNPHRDKPDHPKGIWSWLSRPILAPVTASLACAIFGLYLGYSSPVTDYFGTDSAGLIANWSTNNAIGGSDVFEILIQEGD